MKQKLTQDTEGFDWLEPDRVEQRWLADEESRSFPNSSSEDAFSPQSLEAILARGQALRGEYPQLSSSFWEEAPCPKPVKSEPRFRWLLVWEFLFNRPALVMAVTCLCVVGVSLPNLEFLVSSKAEKHSRVSPWHLPQALPKGRMQHVHSRQPSTDAPTLRAFVKRANTIVTVHSTFFVQQGDELRFIYSFLKPKNLYLVVLMIDQKGNASYLYPDSSQGVMKLSAGREQYLPDGVGLEPKTRWERIYACFSIREIKPDVARLQLLSQTRVVPLQQLKKLSLPCVTQRSWLLVNSEVPESKKNTKD